MKKNIFLLLLAATTLSFAQKTTAVRDTIAKDTTKTKVTEKTPEQKRAEEYAKLIKKGGVERTGLFTVRKMVFRNTRYPLKSLFAVCYPSENCS